METKLPHKNPTMKHNVDILLNCGKANIIKKIRTGTTEKKARKIQYVSILARIIFFLSIGLEQINNSVPSSCGSLKIKIAIIAENMATTIKTAVNVTFASIIQGLIDGIFTNIGTIMLNAASTKI
mgnify:FL=1